MTLFVLAHDQARNRAADFIRVAPVGYEVRITEPRKKRAQEEKYHAMLADISKSKRFEFLGRSDWSEGDIKRILVDAFDREMEQSGNPLSQRGHVIPSLDGMRTLQLGIQTRNFRVKEAAQFIEFLNWFGAELGVEFSG